MNRSLRNTKPIQARTKLCWECGRKFWGGKAYIIEVYGNGVEVHKQCAEELKLPVWRGGPKPD